MGLYGLGRRHRVWVMLGALIVVVMAGGRVMASSQSYVVKLTGEEQYKQLVKLGATIEKRDGDRLILMANPSERAYLSAMGVHFLRAWRYPGITPEFMRSHFKGSAYHNYDTLTEALKELVAAHPATARMQSIGQSVEGREIWALKIAKNPDVKEGKPEIRIVGAHHGDELISVEVSLEFGRYLLENYEKEPRVKEVVDGREVWIVPMLNPDGVERVERYNANGVDLNRNYSYEWASGWSHGSKPFSEPETKAIERLSEQNPFVISLTYHGGALVANFVYNYTEDKTPDDDLIINLSLEYTKRNRPMYDSSEFDHGITRGATWYITNGDLNDWSYGVYGGLDWTIELSNAKIPSEGEIPTIVQDNLESMLYFCEVAGDAIRGIVTDAKTKAPIQASIAVEEIGKPVFSDPGFGDFYRMALPGKYAVTVSAPGYKSQRMTGIEKAPGRPSDLLVFELEKEPSQP